MAKVSKTPAHKKSAMEKLMDGDTIDSKDPPLPFGITQSEIFGT